MTEKIDWIDRSPEGGEVTKTNNIQQSTWPTILWTLEAEKQQPSEENILEKKLELLHTCLVSSEVSIQLPKELSQYAESFELFKQTTKDCDDSFDEIYIEALRKLRDILLENI